MPSREKRSKRALRNWIVLEEKGNYGNWERNWGLDHLTHVVEITMKRRLPLEVFQVIVFVIETRDFAHNLISCLR